MFRTSLFVAVVIALLAAGVRSTITASAQGGPPDKCPKGLVWREAFPGDHVCVTPETRAKARTDNERSGTMPLATARTPSEPSGPRISSPSPGVVGIALGSATRMGAVTVQHDGTILVAATTMVTPRRGNLIRLSLTANGTMAAHAMTQIADVDLNNVGDVTITSEGGIVVVGDAYAPGIVNSQYGGGALGFLVARFLPNGGPDTSFGSSGWTLTDVGQRNNHNIPHGVAVQRDGRILATGNSLVPYWLIMTAYSFATVRYNVDGSLDNTFGERGRVITRMGTSREDDAHAVLVLPDGRIVVVGTADSTQNLHCKGLDCLQAGRSDFSLARYLPDGQLDKSFGRNGRTGPFGLGWATTAYTAALDSHDRVLVGGFVTLSEERSNDRVHVTRAPVIVRYNTDGSLDQSFGNAGVVLLEAGGTAITTVGVQPDAKVVAFGLLRTGKCGSCLVAIRLNADGGSDKGFADDGVFALPFPQAPPVGRGIAVQEDGKLVLAGEQHLQRGQGSAITLVRLIPDGTLDTTFGAAGMR